jgi:hypothetical protein
MAQVFTQDNIPDLVIATNTTITMAATYLGKDTRITIGGQQYKFSATTINFATTGINALDAGTVAANTLYYIYAVVNGGGSIGLVASTSSTTTGPSGYARWKEIGRCRTLSSAATLAAVANRDSDKPRKIEESIESTTSYVIGSTGAIPTPGTGATYLRTTVRESGYAIVRWEYAQSAAGSGGSGVFLLPLSTNETIDFTKINITNQSFRGSVGTGTMLINANPVFCGLTASPTNSSTSLAMFFFSDTQAIADFGGTTLQNTTVRFSVEARLPIVEWQGLYS